MPNIVFAGALHLSKINCVFSFLLLGPFYRMYFWSKQKTVEMKFVKTFSMNDIEEEEKDQQESLASVIIPLSFAKKKSNPYRDNLKGHHIKTFICNLRAPWARNR